MYECLIHEVCITTAACSSRAFSFATLLASTALFSLLLLGARRDLRHKDNFLSATDALGAVLTSCCGRPSASVYFSGRLSVCVMNDEEATRLSSGASNFTECCLLTYLGSNSDAQRGNPRKTLFFMHLRSAVIKICLEFLY